MDTNYDVQIASLFSPAALFLIGSHDERLAVGQQAGASHTINSRRDDPVQLLYDVTGGQGADLVFEGGSRAAGVDLAIRMAKRGGTIVLEGIAGSGALLSLESDIFVLKHLALQGIFGASSAAWTYAVQLFSSNYLLLAQLISHRFALPDYQEALETVMNRHKGVYKVVLVHDESGR